MSEQSHQLYLSFRDIVVSPFTDLLDAPNGGVNHRGGPHWPDWDSPSIARHWVGDGLMDDQPGPADPSERLGTCIWGGAVVHHFGHQIDFSARILASREEWPEVPILFASHPRMYISSLEKSPVCFRGILDWFNVPPNLVGVLTHSVLVDELHVAAQGERLGRAPSPSYLDLLDRNMQRRMGPVDRSGVVYVSRAAQIGRFAGEAYLERILQEAAIHVMRPEALPVAEQLRIYASADRIVFAEGSAVHGLQLLGRGLGDVTILTRRPGREVARLAIEARARSLEYIDSTRGLIHGTDLVGAPAMYWGLSIIDGERLVAELDRTLGTAMRDRWSDEAFTRARDEDVRVWLAREATSPRAEVPGSRDMINATMSAAGVSL